MSLAGQAQEGRITPSPLCVGVYVYREKDETDDDDDNDDDDVHDYRGKTLDILTFCGGANGDIQGFDNPCLV